MNALTLSRRRACAMFAALLSWPLFGQEKKTEQKPDPLVECGIICTLIVLFIVLGAITYILISLIQLCKKLNKKREPPDDPNNGGNTPWSAPNKSSLGSGSAMGVLDMGKTCPPSWDISDWADPVGDGVPNSPFHDADGNPYCIEFDFMVYTADTLSGPWVKTFDVVGFISFSSRDAMQFTDGIGYTLMGQYPPQNIRLKWFSDTTLVAASYGPISQQQGFTVPANLLAGSQSKFFRMAYAAS